MRAAAADAGLRELIAPVRPTAKARYPLIPIESYVEWRRPDGSHFDPWIRLHERVGGEILAPAPRSMVIEAPVSEWEAWTGVPLPADGDHVVPGMLAPLVVADGIGRHVEPNVLAAPPTPAVHRHVTTAQPPFDPRRERPAPCLDGGMPFEVQAHRGNSPDALRTFLRDRPTSIEIDVGVTADGAVVMSHEVRATTVECPASPLLGTRWRDLTADAVRDLGRATLDEALPLVGDTPVLVEVKSYAPHTVGPKDFARALRPYLSRVGVSSFDKRVLSHARRLHRPLETTFLFEQPVRVATAAKTLGPRSDLVTRDLVHAAHALGMRIVPWTVNDPREMHALIELGVDGIVSDDPALLRAVATQAAPRHLRAA